VSITWVAQLRRQFFSLLQAFSPPLRIAPALPYLPESQDFQAFCVDFLAILLGDIDKILID